MIKFSFKHLLVFTALIVGLCAFAQSTTPVNERLGLTLVDNRSVYDPVGQTNAYTNTLRLSQPTGTSPKLTAGMLKEGDNTITITRTDDENNSTDVANLILNATKIVPESEVIDILDFYQDGEGAHTGNTNVTQAMLPENWGTNGSNLIWQASGYAYITGQGGFTYTVPSGYSNVNLQFIIYVGTDARGGYFAYNLNDEGWSIAATASANGVSSFTVSELNAGDVISFYGARVYNNSYQLYQSPDIELIGVLNLPLSYVPTIEVTNNGLSTTYQPNDAIDLYGLGDISDTFIEITEDNEHPSYYNYEAKMDANVSWPSEGTSGNDFYASADFTACTTTDPASGAFVGYNGWAFNASNAYSSSGIISMYIQFYGATIFTMPNTFMGNSVTVTITTSTNSDGAGIVVVNDVSHTFTAGSTYSWTVPVNAGGTIEFKSDGTTYSADITSIVISSGNGHAMSAPSQNDTEQSMKMIKGKKNLFIPAQPLADSKNERNISVKIND